MVVVEEFLISYSICHHIILIVANSSSHVLANNPPPTAKLTFAPFNRSTDAKKGLKSTKDSRINIKINRNCFTFRVSFRVANFPCPSPFHEFVWEGIRFCFFI